MTDTDRYRALPEWAASRRAIDDYAKDMYCYGTTGHGYVMIEQAKRRADAALDALCEAVARAEEDMERFVVGSPHSASTRDVWGVKEQAP